MFLMYFNFFQKCSGGEGFVFDEAIFQAHKAMLYMREEVFFYEGNAILFKQIIFKNILLRS